MKLKPGSGCLLSLPVRYGSNTFYKDHCIDLQLVVHGMLICVYWCLIPTDVYKYSSVYRSGQSHNGEKLWPPIAATQCGKWGYLFYCSCKQQRIVGCNDDQSQQSSNNLTYLQLLVQIPRRCCRETADRTETPAVWVVASPSAGRCGPCDPSLRRSVTLSARRRSGPVPAAPDTAAPTSLSSRAEPRASW